MPASGCRRWSMPSWSTHTGSAESISSSWSRACDCGNWSSGTPPSPDPRLLRRFFKIGTAPCTDSGGSHPRLTSPGSKTSTRARWPLAAEPLFDDHIGQRQRSHEQAGQPNQAVREPSAAVAMNGALVVAEQKHQEDQWRGRQPVEECGIHQGSGGVETKNGHQQNDENRGGDNAIKNARPVEDHHQRPASSVKLAP